jgi:hypothetical protein
MSDARLNAVADAVDLMEWAVRSMEISKTDETNELMWVQLSASLQNEALRRLQDARAIHREMVV